VTTASLIIPVFNHVALTRQCLAALARHTDLARSEVITVDDGSTDATPQLLAAPPFPLIAVRQTTNSGFAAACNRGAAVARGDYLVFLNNDTEPQAGWLDALLEPFADATVGAAGARLMWPDGRLQEAGALIYADGTTAHIGNYDDAAKPEYQAAGRTDYCSAACLAVRAPAFRQAGGFDIAFGAAYGEDADLCCRLQASGWMIRYAPHAVVIHHEGQTTRSWVRATQVATNRERLFRKWDRLLRANRPTVEDLLRQGRFMLHDRGPFTAGPWCYVGNDVFLKRRLDEFETRRPTGAIALYGAGRHTRRLLELSPTLAARVVAIFDDRSECPAIDAIPVRPIGDRSGPAYDYLVISSDRYALGMESKARAWAPAGVCVVNFYRAAE